MVLTLQLDVHLFSWYLSNTLFQTKRLLYWYMHAYCALLRPRNFFSFFFNPKFIRLKFLSLKIWYHFHMFLSSTITFHCIFNYVPFISSAHDFFKFLGLGRDIGLFSRLILIQLRIEWSLWTHCFSKTVNLSVVVCSYVSWSGLTTIAIWRWLWWWWLLTWFSSCM